MVLTPQSGGQVIVFTEKSQTIFVNALFRRLQKWNRGKLVNRFITCLFSGIIYLNGRGRSAHSKSEGIWTPLVVLFVLTNNQIGLGASNGKR